jgi:hypothetical protein
MERMFLNASLFNNGAVTNAAGQPITWSTSSLQLANDMFHNATAFNQRLDFTPGAFS